MMHDKSTNFWDNANLWIFDPRRSRNGGSVSTCISPDSISPSLHHRSIPPLA